MAKGRLDRFRQRLGLGYRPGGEPKPGAPKVSRYSRNTTVPSARLDQDIDDLRKRIERLERERSE